MGIQLSFEPVMEDTIMSMEKQGVVDNRTPGCGSGCGCHRKREEPQTKEAADQMQTHLANDLTDAVASQTAKNKK
jgi:hypothetical protein